jgi:serine/threonine protein kinase
VAGTLTLDDEHRDGPWDELIGTTVGSYRIARLLGKGGMGAVYLAKHPGIGSQVAVKFLHPRFSGDRNHVERFFNEARAVNLIGHENIVKTLDFSVTPGGRHYFVMEYLRGRPLSALKGAAPLEVAGPILLQCCRALQAAHERNIVHRDLKPDNVFLISQMGRGNFVKLVDFGIAKLVDPQSGAGLTETGALLGTPEYMSPEQASGRSSEVGRRSDVYSLGVLMYQLATGRVPFSGPSAAETMVAHLQQKPRPPRELEPSIPAGYEAVILKALEKKKEDRWQSMRELHDAIASCMRELGLSTELPAAADPEPAAPLPAPEPTPQALPLTSTWSGDRAPVQARMERFGDWALAPSRRGRTLAGVLGAIALVVWIAWPAAKAPPPVEKKPAPPAAVTPRPPAAVTPSPPAQVKAPEPPREVKPAERKIARKPPLPPKKPAVPVEQSPGPMTAADAAQATSQHAAAMRARAEMAEAAASAARAESANPNPPPAAKLFVVSDPLGASATVAWSGKSASGLTPIVFRVRRGAEVTVTLSKPGYAAEVRQIGAAQTQVVDVELKALR